MTSRTCENRLAFEVGKWTMKVPKLGSFLDGLHDNIRESELSEELADVVMPVKLSVLGVINFQDSAGPGPSLHGDFSRILRYHIDDAGVLEELDNLKIFGMAGEEVKIMDFGESKVAEKVVYLHEKIALALAAVSHKIKGLNNGKIINIPS